MTQAAAQLESMETLPARQPRSVAEVGELVREAARAGQAIYPAGGQTQWHLGLPPSCPGFLLDIRRLDQVIDYPARDMTITVQAGLTMARLQALLATEKQRLPIDVPSADRATVGGSIAANTSGLRRYAWGTLRDYVIGISTVNDEGHEVKAGGRVVKNVAGYDLCKLHVGSLGTLGIITQVTFKLRPLPEEQALFGFTCPASALDAALAQLHATQTRPVCLELLNPEAAQSLARHFQVQWPREWTIVLGYEANADALKWQVRQLIHEMGRRFDVSGLLGHCANALWRPLVEQPASTEGLLSFTAGMKPSAVAAFCVEADQLLKPVLLQAHAGNGIVVAHILGEPEQATIVRLRGLAAEAAGHLTVTRCPPRWQTAEFVWGPPRGDLPLMKAVKDKLDPRHLFNPGRFIAGI